MAAPHRRPTAPAHPPARLPTTQQLVKERVRARARAKLIVIMSRRMADYLPRDFVALVSCGCSSTSSMATFAGAYPWRSRGSKSASSDCVDDAAAPTAETVDPRRRGPPSRRDRAYRETGGHPAARCLPSAQVVRPPPCRHRTVAPRRGDGAGGSRFLDSLLRRRVMRGLDGSRPFMGGGVMLLEAARLGPTSSALTWSHRGRGVGFPRTAAAIANSLSRDGTPAGQRWRGAGAVLPRDRRRRP